MDQMKQLKKLMNIYVKKIIKKIKYMEKKMIESNYPEYEKIALEIADILDHKNQMYGSSFDKTVDEYGLSVICLRLEDKLNRLKSIVLENRKDFGDEKLEDTLKDLAGYSILSLNYLNFKKEI